MRTHPPTTPQYAPGGKPATAVRHGRRSRIRHIAFWATTFIIVVELVAGSVWNLMTIEWVEVQLRHLGYPHFFTYVLGVWQAGAAVAILAPGFPVIKEWAYAGAFFLWSGAVVSHLAVGDGVESWGVPLMFTTCAIASWLLRPADRRLPETRLSRSGPAGAGRATSENRPRTWGVSAALLVVLYAVSFVTLPAVEDFMHEHAVELGWIAA